MFDEYQLGLYEGKMGERERIIALLEAQQEKYAQTADLGFFGDPFPLSLSVASVIELIKGETE